MNDKLIQIGGKSYKECEVVMLPTKEQRWKIGNEHDDRYEFYSFVDKKLYSRQSNAYNWSLSHLYILSSEEIKEGEDLIKDAWYINTFRGFGKPFQNDNLSNNGYLKQIIATTDILLTDYIKVEGGFGSYNKVPRLSDDFLKAFVKANGKGFDKVLVEYEYKGREYVDEQDGIGYDKVVLKVAPDNTITIKPIQEEKRNIDDVHKECLDYLLTQVEKPADPMNNLVSFNAAQMALNLIVSEIKLGRVKI